MLCRNIDFFAVFFIALGLLAFSKLPALAFPRVPEVRFQQALATDECPISAEVLSQLATVLPR
jgi:hypothetical protein